MVLLSTQHIIQSWKVFGVSVNIMLIYESANLLNSKTISSASMNWGNIFEPFLSEYMNKNTKHVSNLDVLVTHPYLVLVPHLMVLT